MAGAEEAAEEEARRADPCPRELNHKGTKTTKVTQRSGGYAKSLNNAGMATMIGRQLIIARHPRTRLQNRWSNGRFQVFWIFVHLCVL